MASLTNMPAEVRNIIYAQLLSNSKYHPSTVLPQNPLALSTVSNLLHVESTSFFHQHENISVDTSATPSAHATILPPIADKYLRFLRRLTVHTRAGPSMHFNVRKAAGIVASLSTFGASFDQVTISISSNLSQLLNSRVDDSIMDNNHPITTSLRHLLESQVAKTVNIDLTNAWFAPGVASDLAARFEFRLQFFVAGTPITDLSSLERPLAGRFSNSHLTPLGLADEMLTDVEPSLASSVSSSPSSLFSSHCSALGELDTFSVTSFEVSSDDEHDDVKIKQEEDGESSDDIRDSIEQVPFFTDMDIEEWSASTTHDAADELNHLDDLDDDEEMEDVPQEDIRNFMHNLDQVAHHNASEEDLSYMVNFAPDLLLTRHHLSHLI